MWAKFTQAFNPVLKALPGQSDSRPPSDWNRQTAVRTV